MRKDKRSKGIFSLLVRNSFRRLFWSLLVLVLIACIMLGVFMPMANMPYFTLWMVRSRLAEESFDNIDNFGITDGRGSFEVINEHYTVVYPEDIDKSYTEDEIDEFWDVDYLRTKPVRNQYLSDGVLYTQIICSGTENYDGWFLLVDDAGEYVDSANFPYIKDRYSESDLEYYLSDIIYDRGIYKHEFLTNKGLTYHMIIKYDSPAVLLDEGEINLLIGIGAGLVFLYILFIILSIFSVSRKFRKPLKQLDAAMAEFAEGRYSDMHLDHRGVRELKNIMDTFNNMVLKLEVSEAENKRLSREKQGLIADISHDLKTPITIIQGYTDALCQGKIPEEEQADYLEKIQIKTEHLTQLINEFSYYSKIDYQAFEMEPVSVDLCGFVRDFMAENYEYITGGGFEVAVDITNDQYMCRIDPIHFKRCLENLVSNFMKHNPEGSKLHTAVYDAGSTYSVVFENTGTSIAPAMVERLFDPFVMGDKSRTSGKGSGLGLAVVKKIVELHGGSIQYLSKPDYVNCFRISLPK